MNQITKWFEHPLYLWMDRDRFISYSEILSRSCTEDRVRKLLGDFPRISFESIRLHKDGSYSEPEKTVLDNIPDFYEIRMRQQTADQHTGTFRGNQLSLIAGKEGLKYFIENSLDLEVQRKAQIVENYLIENILPLDSRISYRGIGLIWGVDFSGFDNDITKPLIAACFKNGLIVERVGRDNNVLKLMPPLVIEDELLYKGLDILKNSLKEVL